MTIKTYHKPTRVGRPKSFIDYKAIERFAKAHCTQEEIATFLELSVRTLQRDTEFSRIYKKEIEHGKMSLRRKQMQLALGGNTTLLIWLGKQLLDQKDQALIDQSTHNTTVIQQLHKLANGKVIQNRGGRDGGVIHSQTFKRQGLKIIE